MAEMNIDAARNNLISLKKQLLDDLERGADVSETVELEQNKVGRLSRMDAMQQQAMQKASRALIRKRLIQIDKAMKALDLGDYGYCEACGEEISEKRLTIRPEALMCVSCQEQIEAG